MSDASTLPVRRFSARERRSEVLLTLPFLFGAVMMTSLYAVVAPRDVPVLMLVFAASGVMTGLLVALVVAFATLRRLPTVEEEEWRGASVATVRGWAGEWRILLAFQAVSGVAILLCAGLGFVAGGSGLGLPWPARSWGCGFSGGS